MMHCAHPKDPSPPTAPEPSIWSLYLDSCSLQWAVDRWPEDVAAERFLSLLFSRHTKKVVLTNSASLAAGKHIHFEVHGRVYDKALAVFYYELNPKDLTYPQKERLQAFLKGLFANEKNRGYPMFRKVCRALEVAFK